MCVSVRIDDREPPGLVAGFRRHPDVTSVTVERLPVGDVIVGIVGIERKSAPDYVRSVVRRSRSPLSAQADALAEVFENAYVLVEGDLATLEAQSDRVAPEAIRGSVASVTARSGAPVIPCSDRKRLVDLAVRLGRKHGEPPGERPLPASTVTGRDEPVVKRMYACIEGIGPVTAAALYEAFPTVVALSEATVDDLTAVEGIGEERARRILAAVAGEE